MSFHSANSERFSWSFLVIDDNAAEAALIARAITEVYPDAAVELLHEPEHALDVLEKKKFHAVVLDYLMPQIDGLSLLATIVRMRGAPAVLMLTGHGDEEVAVTAIKRGAADYVPKKPDGSHLQMLQHRLRQVLLSQYAQDEPMAVSSFCEGVVGISADGKICFVNDAASRAMKINRASYLGLPLVNFLSGIPSGVEQKFFQRVYGDLLLKNVPVLSRSDFFANGERISDLNHQGVVVMDDDLRDILNNIEDMVPHALYAKVKSEGAGSAMVEVRLLDELPRAKT